MTRKRLKFKKLRNILNIFLFLWIENSLYLFESLSFGFGGNGEDPYCPGETASREEPEGTVNPEQTAEGFKTQANDKRKYRPIIYDYYYMYPTMFRNKIDFYE